MRPVVRGAVVAVLVAVAGLLALGALPGLLKSGDPYHVQATAVAGGTENGAADGNRTAVNASALSERRYPYVTGALAAAGNATDGTGRSDPYWRGPLGVKGAFTHSPFDEFEALREQHPGAAADGTVYALANDTSYRLEIVRPRT